MSRSNECIDINGLNSTAHGNTRKQDKTCLTVIGRTIEKLKERKL